MAREGGRLSRTTYTGRPAKATRFVGGQTLILTDDPDDNTVGT